MEIITESVSGENIKKYLGNTYIDNNVIIRYAEVACFKCWETGSLFSQISNGLVICYVITGIDNSASTQALDFPYNPNLVYAISANGEAQYPGRGTLGALMAARRLIIPKLSRPILRDRLVIAIEGDPELLRDRKVDLSYDWSAGGGTQYVAMERDSIFDPPAKEFLELADLFELDRIKNL